MSSRPRESKPDLYTEHLTDLFSAFKTKGIKAKELSRSWHNLQNSSKFSSFYSIFNLISKSCDIEINEEELKRISADYMNKLLSYEAEEKWLKEEIANHNPELINSIFSDTDTCSFCKNSNANIKKHYCQQCCKRFCIGTCAKLCNTATCSKMSKYICPECVPSCGLCRKNIFCGSCKKSCYYVDCKYTFCPDCYKKNGHQTRAPTSNCAFFTCEVDKTHNTCI